jgi:putative hemolysin
VVGLRRGASREEIAALLEEADEERYPVLAGDDDVVGYVTTRDLAKLLAGVGEGELARLVRPVHVVPETANALELLAELQRRRVPIAVVVDETGAFEGIVDVDDLAEEIVGSLVGEAERTAPARADDGSAVVPASSRVHLVNRLLALDLPLSPRWSTVGGLVLAHGGAIPKVGDTVTLEDGTRLEVVETSARRLLQVRIHPPPRARSSEPPSA